MDIFCNFSALMETIKHTKNAGLSETQVARNANAIDLIMDENRQMYKRRANKKSKRNFTIAPNTRFCSIYLRLAAIPTGTLCVPRDRGQVTESGVVQSKVYNRHHYG